MNPLNTTPPATLNKGKGNMQENAVIKAGLSWKCYRSFYIVEKDKLVFIKACLALHWSIMKYLMIEIAVIDAWVPCDDARIDTNIKKHINLFLNPFPNKITEHKKVAYPMACCIVTKNKSFLMTWLIFNFTRMNPKHAKADAIPNIPVAIRR